MNKYQKEYLQYNIKDEKAVLKKLRTIYEEALENINNKISTLLENEELKSKIYQVRYQKALKRQIEAILDKIDDYSTISQYLEECYDNGYLGVMYDLNRNDIPIIIPINQNLVTHAIVKETKLTDSLYKRLGYNKKILAEALNMEISRGIASSMSYIDIARMIDRKFGIGINKAQTIARTEGHRVSMTAAHHARLEAKNMGCNIVKQWDATLDRRTRKEHAMLDGQIREIDDYFEIENYKALYPSGFGNAYMDINCRCVALQRATWDLDQEELDTLKQRAEYFELDKSENFEDFKKKYLTIN